MEVKIIFTYFLCDLNISHLFHYSCLTLFQGHTNVLYMLSIIYVYQLILNFLKFYLNHYSYY